MHRLLVLIALLLVGVAATAQTGSMIGCSKAGARDKTQGLHGLNVGFRYNPFVITTLATMKGTLEANIREMGRADPAEIPALQARLRAVEAHIASLPDYKRKRAMRSVRIAHAPLFARTDPRCAPGRILLLPGEYVIHSNGGNLRAVGDLCASDPAQLILETRTSGGQLSLDRIVRSPLGKGRALDEWLAKDALNDRANLPFEALILDILAVTKAQCGQEADRLHLRVRYDDFALQKILDGQLPDEVLLDIYPAKDGYRMDATFTPRAAERLRYFQQRRERFDAYVANRDERAAIGGILVVIGASLLGAASPCWDDPNNFSC